MLDTCLLAMLLAQDPIAAHSASEPPAAKQAASLTASTKDSPQNLLTTGEKTGWNETAPTPKPWKFPIDWKKPPASSR
jgi:hypothetical protein